MTVLNKPLDWYIEKIKNKEYFSQGMFGDGEWEAIFHTRVGLSNAEETKYTPELCAELKKSLHFKADNFFFSVPQGLDRPEVFGPSRINNFLRLEGLNIEFYEKDMWDQAMKSGELKKFIDLLRTQNVCIISNKALRGLHFLGYDKFIEISYPNCYLDGSLDRAYDEAIAYGKPGVYIIAAGLPAALLVQKLHGKIPNSWFLDLGSIWDGFVHIGAQRGFRAALYEDKKKYFEWFDRNLFGTMAMTKNYIADHYSVLKVKVEKGLQQHRKEFELFESYIARINPALIEKLYLINKEMFELQDEVMKEEDGVKVGEIMKKVLSLNGDRVKMRSEVAKQFEEFTEYKTYV